jgi:lysophospholipase L1-like esterase
MNTYVNFAKVLVTSLVMAASFCTAPSDTSLLTVKGRTDMVEGKYIGLISPAASVTFGVKGSSFTLLLSNQDTYKHHNYVVIEVDGKFFSRNKIAADDTTLKVTIPEGNHTVSVYKATEASIGTIVIKDIQGNITKAPQVVKKKIEFIGDSITCGMGNDDKEIPCGQGEWYDQHNAYYSYASITARALNADYVLNSVSGIGMYRNWNDEHDKEVIMPQAYGNLYLNSGVDNTKKYTPAFVADVTCIALGTNDFSKGDGTKPRLPFNEDAYVNNYVAFVKMLYKHAPKTQVVLTNSPMVNMPESAVFTKCLNRVKDLLNKEKGHKAVMVFTYGNVTPTGCGYHPAIKEDEQMAAQLTPFLKKLL